MTNGDFAARLKTVSHQLGGNRALAQAMGVSEAQLYRYLSGVAEPSASKIHAITSVTGVDPSWLLGGSQQQDLKKFILQFNSQLLQDVYQILEEALLDVPRVLPPQLRSKVFTAIFMEYQLHQLLQHRQEALSVMNMLYKIYFILSLHADVLPDYLAFIQQDLLQTPVLHEYKLEPLCNHICRASAAIYDTPIGEYHFDQLGQTVLPPTAQRLHTMATTLLQQFPQRPLRFLEVGCGNGRELSYMHRHFEALQVHGVDIAKTAINSCQQLVSARKLRTGCVTQGDVRKLPHPDASFDAVYARHTLQCIPYIAHADFGLNQALRELHRVLKPGGSYMGLERLGATIHLPYAQGFTTDMLKNALIENGFTVLDIQLNQHNMLPEDTAKSSFNETLLFHAQK